MLEKRRYAIFILNCYSAFFTASSYELMSAFSQSVIAVIGIGYCYDYENNYKFLISYLRVFYFQNNEIEDQRDSQFPNMEEDPEIEDLDLGDDDQAMDENENASDDNMDDLEDGEIEIWRLKSH